MTRPAPAFCLPTCDDRKKVRLSDCLGKVVLLYFWVTWCPACQADLPNKERLHRSINHPDFVFLSINVTGREANPAAVPAFLERAGFTFLVLKDDGRKTYDAYGITSVPASVLIDRKGNLAGIYDETAPLLAIIREIDRLLRDS